MSEPAPSSAAVERYYRLHARIYDATRWSYLFGRAALIRAVAAIATPKKILEVGCGTGQNLTRLRRAFPDAHLTGLDLSAEMLHEARKKFVPADERVSFVLRSYDQPLQREQPFDLVLFSYSLTMINPGWEQAIDLARRDLAPGGLLAVVDFHTGAGLFQRWMRMNHVRMDGHLLPVLQDHFTPRLSEIHPVYAGLWTYLLFVGAKAA